MKRWRVGTFSAGVSLVFIGVMLLVSSWRGTEGFDALLAWWPVIFIMLGIEILLYLFIFAKKDNPVIHYDIVSMIFVSVFCILCLGFFMLSSTGVIKEIRSAVGAEERTLDLPRMEWDVLPNVQKIVLQLDQPAKIDKSDLPKIHIFGNYRAVSSEGSINTPVTGEQYTTVQTVGSTMYVTVKELPRKAGPFSVYTRSTVTVVVPQNVQTEIRGMYSQSN